MSCKKPPSHTVALLLVDSDSATTLSNATTIRPDEAVVGIVGGRSVDGYRNPAEQTVAELGTQIDILEHRVRVAGALGTEDTIRGVLSDGNVIGVVLMTQVSMAMERQRFITNR